MIFWGLSMFVLGIDIRLKGGFNELIKLGYFINRKKSLFLGWFWESLWIVSDRKSFDSINGIGSSDGRVGYKNSLLVREGEGVV